MTDGSYVTLEVKNGLFSRIKTQQAPVPPDLTSRFLTDIGDLNQLPLGTKVDAAGSLLLPGMIDGHVHSRDPGLTHKESWDTLGHAAFKGGVVAVCDMPNTHPATVDRAAVRLKAERAAASGLYYEFYLGVSDDNLDQLTPLMMDSTLPLCGLKVFYGTSTGPLKFSDLARLTAALHNCKRDVLIAFHAEEQGIIDANGAHFCTCQMSNPIDYAIHSKVRDKSAAIAAVEKIADWAVASSHRVHICHVSSPEEVDIVCRARAKGARITMEVAPHHMWFHTGDYEDWGGFLKVNPPVREEADRLALCRLFAAGDLFDIFATDHAPHAREEKLQRDYDQCPSGMPAIEFFTPLLLTLGRKHHLSLGKAVKMATAGAAHLFGWSHLGSFEAGRWASFCLVHEGPWIVDDAAVEAKCGWSPYVGVTLDYKVLATWQKGKRVYKG
jgi:dihydroorotase